MVCVRCKKRPAIIFIQRMENGQMKQEGYCLHCAREMHIKPVEDLMKQFGMSEQDMDNMEDRMDSMMEEMGDGANPLAMMMGMQQDGGDDGGGDTDGVTPGGNATRFEKQGARLISGQCLPAKRTGFVHPTTGEFLRFDSELPEYFTELLRLLREG